MRFCREQRDYVAGLIQQLAGVPAAAAAYTQDAGGAGLGALATLLPLAVPEDSPAELADFIRNPLFLRSPDANARSVQALERRAAAMCFRCTAGVQAPAVWLSHARRRPAQCTASGSEHDDKTLCVAIFVTPCGCPAGCSCI